MGKKVLFLIIAIITLLTYTWFDVPDRITDSEYCKKSADNDEMFNDLEVMATALDSECANVIKAQYLLNSDSIKIIMCNNKDGFAISEEKRQLVKFYMSKWRLLNLTGSNGCYLFKERVVLEDNTLRPDGRMFAYGCTGNNQQWVDEAVCNLNENWAIVKVPKPNNYCSHHEMLGKIGARQETSTSYCLA